MWTGCFPGNQCLPENLEENLKVIGALAPYVSGGLGFDNRYEGIKGSPRLSDTLLPSLLRIKGQDSYFELKSDIDLVQNSVIYSHPNTGKLFVIPCNIVEELIIARDGQDLVFRTTYGKTFEKELKDQKFIQILNDGDYQFIKMPVKILVEADYKRVYSSDRRYDEFQAKDRYYLLGPDNVFYQIQLNRKSVLKIYPDRKKIIEQEPDERSFADKEHMVISLLKKF
jgi:hypothetical protein